MSDLNTLRIRAIRDRLEASEDKDELDYAKILSWFLECPDSERRDYLYEETRRRIKARKDKADTQCNL